MKQYKVLWDAVIKCRNCRIGGYNKDEWAAYCACCPLGRECAEADEQADDEFRNKHKD